MKKFKIAILDSGCSLYQMKELRIVKTVNFISEDKSCKDDHGHGTAILYIISKMQPTAEYIILKVLDKNASSKICIINSALEYLQNISVDYICMSFSTALDYKNEEMYQICQKLNNQGKVLIAARANSGERSYPAEFDNVIGVEGILFDNFTKFWYSSNSRIQAVADITPIMAPDKNYKGCYMFGGNSKACALLCGLIVAQDLEAEQFLLKKRMKKKWEENDIAKGKIYSIQRESQIFKTKCFEQVYLILNKYIDNLTDKTNLHEYLSPVEYYDILVQIEKICGISIDYYKMEYSDFDTVSTLYEKVKIKGADLAP